MLGIILLFIILFFIDIINSNSKLNIYIQTISRMKLNYKIPDRNIRSKIN